MSSDAPDAVGEVIKAQLADLVAYCRALTGEEADAVSTANSVVDSAHSLLNDPALLRAWLFALARRQVIEARPGGGGQADSPQPGEILDLVYRHGIRRQDLHLVLGIPASEAEERLAAAEADREGLTAERADDDTDPFGGQRLADLERLMRTPPDSASTRAAQGRIDRDSWRAFVTGRARLAAGAAITVAVIGVGTAYLVVPAHRVQPTTTGLESSHHPSPLAALPSPANTPSPRPTASAKHRPAPSGPVTMVNQLPLVATSTKPKPSPTKSSSPRPPSPAPTTPPPTSPPTTLPPTTPPTTPPPTPTPPTPTP